MAEYKILRQKLFCLIMFKALLHHLLASSVAKNCDPILTPYPCVSAVFIALSCPTPQGLPTMEQLCSLYCLQLNLVALFNQNEIQMMLRNFQG